MSETLSETIFIQFDSFSHLSRICNQTLCFSSYGSNEFSLHHPTSGVSHPALSGKSPSTSPPPPSPLSSRSLARICAGDILPGDGDDDWCICFRTCAGDNLAGDWLRNDVFNSALGLCRPLPPPPLACVSSSTDRPRMEGSASPVRRAAVHSHDPVFAAQR